jgi:hypothetical protein
MKKFPWKQIFVILVLGVGVFALVEIYKAYKAGKTAISDLLMAPWTALKAAAGAVASAVTNSTPVQGAVALTQLPLLTATETTNAAQQGVVAGSYQPGGTMYQAIAATQGQPAADAAAAAAANNAATQTAQATADSSWSTSPWNPSTWF